MQRQDRKPLAMAISWLDHTISPRHYQSQTPTIGVGEAWRTPQFVVWCGLRSGRLPPGAVAFDVSSVESTLETGLVLDHRMSVGISEHSTTRHRTPVCLLVGFSPLLIDIYLSI